MRKFLGEILVEMEVCSTDEINAALSKQMNDNDRRPVGEILTEMEACTPEDVARALAEQYDMRFYDLETIDIPKKVVELVPQQLAMEKKVIPVSLNGRTLSVAMTNPLDLEIVDSLRFTTSLAIEVGVASERQVKAALEKVWGVSEEALDKMLGELTEDIAYRQAAEDGGGEGDDALIVKFVQQIIANALNSRASDIHIEPMSDHLRIRYRIDGVCFTMDPAPKRLQGPVIQRLKIMADMRIEEKRMPQDGRIKVKIGDKKIDLRVSCLPAIHGESVVMRILDSENLKKSLDDAGFDPSDLKIYNGLIKRPNGIILVTGPTGSGKTTTLYATLNALNTVDRKIITAEDPIEYNLAGINQCQINSKIGLDFPRILRSMLRQAPNVILVGEIRDGATANIAIQAALTGHLVFSTLHTNDAPSAITRLIDMGVAPFLVATSIQAIVAQRLVRTNCPHCLEPFEPDPRQIELLDLKPEQLAGRRWMHGKGCDQCKGSGYRSRRGIFEMMVMTRQIRDLAFNRAPASEVRRAAIANGMCTLAMDGARKALQGITTPEEVLRMAKAEG
ncbi:MAG: type II/IV secretion system protein [Planctomycetes bacterium]|nr:type II/IV secretion system protein [Planctomycetota bacterium]